jgi:hypothetical protein
MSIGRLRRVPLREVWKHEAHDFTTWLEENIEILNEVLDFDLSNVEREKAAGSFSVDLVGEDTDGRTVIIENQLEPSDHRHLGQVLTYLAALDAHAGIWIVARPRPEHVKAIAWLNEATSNPFYLIQVEAVRIGESDPAPLLTRIVGPSAEARAVGETRRQQNDRQRARRSFWEQLLEHANSKLKLHANVSPTNDSWVGAGAGKSGITFNYIVKKEGTRVELYINTGDRARNEARYDALHAQKEAIEEHFGGPLHWERLEGRQTCRISASLIAGGWRDEATWPAAIEATTDAMHQLHRALKGPVRALD